MEIKFFVRDNTLHYEGEKPANNLEGVDISIAKWTALRDGGRWVADGGTQTCGLCMIHWKSNGCETCPIACFTGEDSCEDTPYDDWEDSTEHSYRQVAQNEIDFLLMIREEILDAAQD